MCIQPDTKPFNLYGGTTIQTALREDEIDALLKFDGARLSVIHRDDLVGQVEPYTAIIVDKEGASLARGGASRLQAVTKVWEVYNEFRGVPHQKRRDPRWLYEQAMGDVEIHLKKLLEEKHNGNNK